MISIARVVINAATALLLSAGVIATAHAHLMVAQNGTLNFLDDSVYMVLSLPASAFAGADENNDSELSLTEFSRHRTRLISAVKEQVTLSTEKGHLPLHGIMVSPVTPHNDPKAPAKQVIVMGRFSLAGSENELSFHVGLYGSQSDSRALKITANRKSENQRQVFELTPEADEKKLSFN